ncbi:MAG TPA: MBL fold metallo-hydrolase [Vicinamibacterales bacterium]|nr:MBL fold metallo-hydrolase [Vicinamibacterales bacterium]
MRKPLTVAALLILVSSTPAVAQDAKTVIDLATRTLGATGLTSVTYSGSAATGNFGQSRTVSFGLASTSIGNYTRTIDFTQPRSQANGTTMPPTVPGLPPPQPGTFNQTIAPESPWTQQLQIWVTPWGFLRGAAANNATMRSQKIEGTTYKVVTWITPQKAPSGQPYRVVGYINPQNLIEHVETWVEHPILGDMHVDTMYSDYQDFGGLKVPTRVDQRQTGMSTFVAKITYASPNPPNIAQLVIPPPAPGRGDGAGAGTGRGAAAGGPPTLPAVASEKLADGVYRITGGYVSLAVELKDSVVVLEGGQSEARGLAVIAETKRLIPNKRIRYVVNTHPHFDHAGGLAPFAAEGITIITHNSNKYFLEQALGSPRTLVGDALAKSRKKPKLEEFIEMLVLGDSTRSIELHHIEKLEHSDGMLVAYLPKERILFTADFNVPGPGQPVSPSIATLVDNIERLKLDFDRHVLVHPPNPDRPMTKADLMTLAGRAR